MSAQMTDDSDERRSEHEQVHAMPEGPRKDVAVYLHQYCHFPDEPICHAIYDPDFVELRRKAGGSFYKRDGELVFFTMTPAEMATAAALPSKGQVHPSITDPELDEIEAEIEALPEGPKKDLAQWMNTWYGFGNTTSFEPTHDDTLIALCYEARGGFCVKGGRLVFFEMGDRELDNWWVEDHLKDPDYEKLIED